MKKHASRILWITQTAALLALLVVLQLITKSAGQLVTGSCVNAILALSAALTGTAGGACVALVSPFIAFLLGIAPPFFPITPIIALGNLAFVLLMKLPDKPTLLPASAAVVRAATAKFLVLYLLVVQGVCRFAALPAKLVDTFSAMFSFPQLITALIGGALAALMLPVLRKAIRPAAPSTTTHAEVHNP